MKNRKWLQVLILSAVLVIAAVTVVQGMTDASSDYPKEGSKAPAFELADLNGEIHSLSDYRGKLLVLNFWGTFCPPCRSEMPALEKQAKEWESRGVAVLGVNLRDDNDVAVKSFLREYGITFTSVRDRNDEVRQKYGVFNYPTTFFIGPDGRILQIRTGEMDEAFLRNTLSALTSET